MIDIETLIFAPISTALRAAFPGVSVSGEAIQSPAKFPAVTIVEQDNAVYQKMRSGTVENHASLMYEVTVCSNKQKRKKQECKSIISLVDEQFALFGFTRISASPIPNLSDGTIYRMVARYRAIADQSGTIYTK